MTSIGSFFAALGLSILVHVLVWFSINSQFIKEISEKKALLINMVIAMPLGITAFYAAKITYGVFKNSVWGVRFFGFSTSYLVFPILTWLLLSEPTFTSKNILCFLLALMIIIIQIKC
jgi:hypothetical protein